MQDSKESADEAKVDLATQERRARRFWVGLVVTLLGTQVAIGMFSLYLSVGDPSNAIIPDYYRAAVNWDVTRRARELTQDLQWDVAPTVSQAVDGERVVSVHLVDGERQPVRGVHIRGQVFHHARGGERYALQFSEIADGVYATPTQLTQSGLWQLRLRMEGDHGIAEHEQELRVE